MDGWPIEMKSGAEVNSFMDRSIDQDEWILHVKQYVKDKQAELIRDKKLIFVIESQCFRTPSNPTRDVSVIVSKEGVDSNITAMCFFKY